MGCLIACALAFQAAAQRPDPNTLLPKILERVSEEAEVFRQAAPRVVGEEALEHKGRRMPGRFQLSQGADPSVAPKISYVRRRVVSEYGFGALSKAPDDIREFRQVVNVDGRAVVKREKARQTLAFNMVSEDDRARKKMLEEFEKHGMIGAASDLGQAILLFRRSNLANYEFTYDSTNLAGLEPALVFKYRQKEGAGMHLYEGKTLSRPKMSGELWVRRRDYLPVRVTFEIESKEGPEAGIHMAQVEYERSRSHGVILPMQTRYTRRVKGEVMVENVAAYSRYVMFKADVDIKFTPEEEAPEK